MANRLEFEIGAEIKELNKKLSEAQSKLKGFSSDADKNLNKFSKASNTATKDVRKFQKGAISGSAAMTSFSRTIQDAPFGLMGVSNNITNLTEQFGYLKAKTGSSGGALKAMLRDLKGFGGISLGISAVTSLLLVFGDKIFESKNKVKALKEEQEKLTQSLDDYVYGLEAVQRVNLKGEQSATKELTTLRLLKSQVENTTLSLKERKDAIEELRKKYPDYLKNMSDEKLLNGGLEKTYNSLTTSIIKRAKATASVDEIVKNSKQLLALEDKLLTAKEKATQAENAYQNKLKTGTVSQKSGVVVGLQQLKNEANAAKKEVNSLEGAIQNLELTNIDLEANVKSEGGIAKTIIPDGTADEIRTKVQALGSGLKNDLVGVQDVINETPLQIINDKTLSEFDVKQALLKQKLLEFNEGVSNIIQGTLSNTFSQLGQSLGQALATGGNALQAVGNAIIGGMANFLGQLGKMMIEYGTMAVLKGKLDLAILAGGPVAIGAGLAAIAVGVALSALSGAIGSFSSSGGNSNVQGGQGSSFSGGSSFSSGGGSSFGGGNVVFEIQGQKLVGVLRNTLDRNRNLGGTLTI